MAIPTTGRTATSSDDHGQPASKAALLARMRAERAVWNGLMAAVPAPIRTLTVLPSHWSVKDLAAHIAAYERWTAAQIAAANAGRRATDWELYGVECLPPEAATWDVDQQNDAIYRQYRDTPLAEVMDFADRAFGDLVTAVAAVPEEDLRRPGLRAWMGHLTLLEIVPAQSYEHYQQHIDDLRAVVTGVAPEHARV
jgi:hypothetical protein